MPQAALAQARTPSAGQLVPPSLAPQVRDTPGGVVLPAPPESGAPAGADKIMLTVGDVAIEGGDAALADETKAALAPIRDRKVSVAEVYAAVARIERAYAARGYFLTRVIIPPQTVKARGGLKLLVVQGYIESVSGDGLPDAVRARAVAVVGAVADKRPLTLAAFERALLIAGDTAGLDLRTRLTVGDKPGAVKLVLEGSYRPVTLELSGDNSLSRPLGLWTSTFSGSLNSVFGFGEQVYVNLTGSPTHGLAASDTPRRLAAAGIVLPIGLDGFAVNVEGAWSQTEPLTLDAAALPTETEYERLSLRLSYPLLRTRSDTLMLHSAFDAVSETQKDVDFATTRYDDDIRALRLGADWSHAFSPQTLASLGFNLSQGISGLGSRDRDDAVGGTPISTAAAHDDFTKIEGQARLVQTLPANFSTEWAARGQYSFNQALFKSEQFSIGGPHLLSGYDAGDVFGDSGWMVRGELRYDHTVQTEWAAALVQPYLFGATGQVFVTDPTAVERATVSASSIGGGARVTMAPNLAYLRELELGIEGARQFSNDIDGKDGWRFNLYLASRY